MRSNKFVITSICLSLILASSIIAYAYFTDYESALGGAVIHFGGSTETEEKFDGNNKVVAIRNTGDTDMVVRVMVFGDEDFMTVETGDSWIDGGDGAYYYNSVLKAGETSPELKVSVSGRVSTEDPINFDIIVAHESSRVAYEQNNRGKTVVRAPEGWTGFPVISAE